MRSTILEGLDLCVLGTGKVKTMLLQQFKKGTPQKPHRNAFDKWSQDYQVETFILLEGCGSFIP